MALSVFLAAMLVAHVASCRWLWQRWQKGLPLVPWAWRRRARWDGAAIGAVVLLFIALERGLMELMQRLAPAWKVTGGAAVNGGGTAAEAGAAPHPLVQLIEHADRAPWVLVAALLFGVLIAPVVEEFLFRVLLQGYLEAREWRWRRRWPWLRWLPQGALSLVTPAVIFSLLHVRNDAEPMDPQRLAPALVANGLAGLLTVVVGAQLLKRVWGASATDLGFRPWVGGEDARIAAVALGLSVVPLYAVQIAAAQLLAGRPFAPDPAPLLLLALVLGYLYQRTHRIWPSVLLHLGFNATSLLLLALSPRP